MGYSKVYSMSSAATRSDSHHVCSSRSAIRRAFDVLNGVVLTDDSESTEMFVSDEKKRRAVKVVRLLQSCLNRINKRRIFKVWKSKIDHVRTMQVYMPIYLLGPER